MIKPLTIQPIKHYCFEISARNREHKKKHGVNLFEGDEESFAKSEKFIKMCLKNNQ